MFIPLRDENPTRRFPGGVAWFAHIGGFLVGMVLVKLFGGRRVRLVRPN